MISLQSIAVAAAATGLTRDEQAKLMRFTVRHSIFLAAMIGLVTLFYAYVMPGWVRSISFVGGMPSCSRCQAV